MERGLLDLSIQLSTRNIIAGNEFAIFVLVKNPFDKPVWVREVNVSLPSELEIAKDKDSEQKIQESNQAKENAILLANQQRAETKETLDGLLSQLNQLSSNLDDKNLNSNQIEFILDRIRYSVERYEDSSSNEVHIQMESGEIGTLKIGSSKIHLQIGDEKPKIESLHIYDPQIENLLSINRTVKLKSSLPEGVALQSGSTAVYTVTLNVKKSLVFTPTLYRLQFYVNYSFSPEQPKTFPDEIITNEELLTNTIAHELAIRPSVYSVIIGAMLGGLVGSLARSLQTTPLMVWQNFTTGDIITSSITIMLAVILSAISVIFMARKSEAQAFVSIEDFWGGLLIGFLVGYTGTSFFEKLTGIVTPTP